MGLRFSVRRFTFNIRFKCLAISFLLFLESRAIDDRNRIVSDILYYTDHSNQLTNLLTCNRKPYLFIYPMDDNSRLLRNVPKIEIIMTQHESFAKFRYYIILRNHIVYISFTVHVLRTSALPSHYC